MRIGVPMCAGAISDGRSYREAGPVAFELHMKVAGRDRVPYGGTRIPCGGQAERERPKLPPH